MKRAWLLLLVGCSAGPPPPRSIDEKTAEKTPPSDLCDRYVALAASAGPLDDGSRKGKHEKCVGKASSVKVFVPKDYACLVQCTYAATTYAVARVCPDKCRSGGHELPTYDEPK